MKTSRLQVRNLQIGEGIPKICIPIVERTQENIINQAKQVMAECPDIIELRMDCFEEVKNPERVTNLLKQIRHIVEDTVLLFTVRTREEGGELSIRTEEYMKLCQCACEGGCIDLLDVEAYKDTEVLQYLVAKAHEKGVFVVASNHDFVQTPPMEDIVERLLYMDECGADIPKIAVMPQSQKDVLNLLMATVEYYNRGYNKPVITMSMGGSGAITRLSGEIFGSAVTFASVGKCSAPGQLPVAEVKHILETLHEYR